MFTVQWADEALDELAREWLGAGPRQRRAISAATHAIDQRLRVNPAEEGESRSDDRRVIIERPLGATYRVIPDDRLVQVLHVWRTDRRQQRS